MNKIIAGFLGLVMITAVVGGTAYAVFTSSVNVNNVAISAGNADLEFSPDDINWSQNYTYAVWEAQNVYPGYSNCSTFYVKNVSTSPITLDLTAQLTSATGNWGVFSDLLDIWFTSSEHATPAVWNSAPQSLGVNLAQEESTSMELCMTVPTSADNAIAGQTLSTNWEIVGTQAL